MIQQIIFLIIGLAGLWIGADFLIRGAKNIALFLGISYFFVGLAFVSIGTSIPEIAVSVVGGIDRLMGMETSGIVVGNKIGSALSQISLIIGILAFFMPLKLKRQEILKQGIFLIAAILLVFGLAYNGYLSRLDGVIAIIAYLIYYIYIWISNDKKRAGRPPNVKLLKNVLIAILGLIIVIFCSEIVVENGVALAQIWGVSQSLVGILIIGLGTGLPELSVAVASIRRKSVGISIGDLIGSNICDLLLALGLGTVISGFIVERVNLWFDLPVLLLFSLIVIYFFYTKGRLSKKEGVILISLFVIYALIKIFVVG